jgi:hypothetical protein
MIRFALEPLQSIRIVAENIRQDFKGRLAAEVRVLGTADFASTTLADFFEREVLKKRCVHHDCAFTFSGKIVSPTITWCSSSGGFGLAG